MKRTSAHVHQPAARTVTRAAPVLPRPKRIGLIRCLLLMAMGAAASWAASPISLDIAVKSIGAPQPPRLVGDVLILSFRPDQPTRFVGVRFAHESWRVLHPCAMNDKGVFVLDYELPEGVRELRYRIVEDGLWTTDPSNPDTDVDSSGVAFSVYTLQSEPVRTVINPKPGDGGLTFVFNGPPGKRVALVGDFNAWDPFMDLMDETTPGTYSISLRVPPGGHWYYFLSDGRRILDRHNAQTGTTPDGVTVSYFESTP